MSAAVKPQVDVTKVGKDPLVEFQDRLQQSQPTDPAAGGAAQIQDPNAATGQVAPASGLDPARSNSVNRVNGGYAIPDKQDMFGQMEHVRKDFNAFLQKSSDLDKLVAEGKLKSNDPKVTQARQAEMRTLLHFQLEMQGAAMKVEIASKVVEHATSGVKTVLTTQA
jgi:hypothetical protein